MEDNKKCCDIEQHAVLFGLLAREAITLCPETGLEAVRMYTIQHLHQCLKP